MLRMSGAIYLLLFALPSFAQTINIKFINASNETVTIVKQDGTIFTSNPYKDIENIAVNLGEEVKGFVNNELHCTWTITDYKTFALAYDIPTHGACAIFTYKHVMLN